MNKPPHSKEKRKHPRTLLTLPLHLKLNKKEAGYPGLTLDASESGLLIQTFKEMPVGIKIDIEVLFHKKLKWSNFKAEAEIIWKDISYWDDWEGYQYGLRFIQISNEDHSKLKEILCNPVHLKEIDLIESRDHNPRLVVKTE